MADLKQMWAHNCHSFVLTTGLNGRWVKALVLSSRSVRAFEVPAEDVHRTGAHKPERATPVVFPPTAFSQTSLFLVRFPAKLEFKISLTNQFLIIYFELFLLVLI